MEKSVILMPNHLKHIKTVCKYEIRHRHKGEDRHEKKQNWNSSDSLLFAAVITGGQVIASRIETAENKDATTYTIGYLPITHALPVFEEKELLEAQNADVQIKLQKFSSWSDLTDALHAGK